MRSKLVLSALTMAALSFGCVSFAEEAEEPAAPASEQDAAPAASATRSAKAAISVVKEGSKITGVTAKIQDGEDKGKDAEVPSSNYQYFKPLNKMTIPVEYKDVDGKLVVVSKGIDMRPDFKKKK